MATETIERTATPALAAAVDKVFDPKLVVAMLKAQYAKPKA